MPSTSKRLHDRLSKKLLVKTDETAIECKRTENPASSSLSLESIKEPRISFSNQLFPPRHSQSRRETFSESIHRFRNRIPTPKALSAVSLRNQFRAATPDHDIHSIQFARLYAHPQQIDNWLVLNPNTSDSLRYELEKIAGVPTAVWLDDMLTVKLQARRISINAKAEDSLYQVVLCGAPYILNSLEKQKRVSYLKYIRIVANSLSGTPGIVILEPGLISNAYSMKSSERQDIMELLSTATRIIRNIAPLARVYIDAGKPGQIPAASMAMMLKMAGVCTGRGFALNVGHAEATRGCLTYAQELRRILGDKIHFVLDTSRNGVGSQVGPLKNNFSLRLGERPTTKIQCLDELSLGMDALLWVKPPGLSEGNSNGHLDDAPPSGLFWVDSALSLLGFTKDASGVIKEMEV